MKWIIIAIIAIFIISALGNSNSSSNSKKVGTVSDNDQSNETTASGTSTTETTEATEAAEPVQEVYHIGDILKDGNTEIIYMSSGTYEEENEYLKAKDGNKYIYIQLAFKNTSTSSDTSVSLYSFEAYADGYNVDAYYGGDDSLSSTLSAGRSTSGYLYYEVPEDAQEIEIEYTPNFLSDEKITFAFDGDADSGYVLETNTEATEGALQVGDVTESKELRITYLSCFADSSDNMFITPKDGYHYVTCELEFENLSSSDQSISVYSFDCYADGIDCIQAFFRDDELNSTLSSGRKAKGTVTFEVPDNAETVELEFLSNYWTSNRVVFTISES